MKLRLYNCLHAESLHLCPTLCDPKDCSLPRSLSMAFLRHECCSGLLCPPPGDLPNPGTNPASFMPLAFAGSFFTTSATWEAPLYTICKRII